jgi:hypothetical protein
VYDMYPWDDAAGRHQEDASAVDAGRATHAVQVALDRRDNGGDAMSGPNRQ